MMNSKLKTIAFLFILQLLLSSCNISRSDNKLSTDYFVGFIESTGRSHTGYVNFVNDEGNLTQKVNLDEGGVLLWNKHKIFKESIYFGANGLATKKNAGLVFEVNRATGAIKKYSIWEKPITAIAVNDATLFAAGNLNHQYQIISCDKLTGKCTALDLEDAYIRYMELYDNYLYAFVEKLQGNNAGNYIYIIDINDMRLIEKVDIRSCGSSQRSSCKIYDVLYFTNNLAGSDLESKHLSSYNVKTKQLKNYELGMPYPYQIVRHDNSLIISHYNPTQSEGSSISVFDLKTEKSILVELEDKLGQIEVHEDKLLAANFAGAGEAGAILSVYDLFSFAKTSEMLIDRIDQYNYFSGFFICP